MKQLCTDGLRRLGSATLLGLLAAASQAAPFANGSLESSASAVNIVTVGAGQTADGWTAVGSNIEFVKAGYNAAGDALGPMQAGSWLVDLNGTGGPGGLQQSFDTLAGQWYEVVFYMSGNAGPNGSSATGPKTLDLAWNGATVSSASYAHLPGDQWNNLRWERHAVMVQALGSSSTLGFISTYSANPAAGAFIDDIRVSAVPEPGSVALLLAGLLGLAAVARRRSPR